jgi:predicted enzyme related to lactoylglutathione lyase
MSIKNVLASVAVQDLDAAVKWYEKLLGASASRPMPEVAEWKFERGGWLQVYELAERAGSGSFTLVVDDMDEQISRLKKLGADTSKQASGQKVKTLMIADPDGNHIAFAEPNDPRLAQ